MIGTFMLATTLPTGFAPASDFGFVNLSIELPPGARLQDTVDTVDQVRARLDRYPEIEHVFALSNPRSANLFITLKDRTRARSHAAGTADPHRRGNGRHSRRAHPRRQGNGPPGNGPVQIELTGDDSTVVAATAAQVEREIRALPGFSSVSTSASLLQPELVIRPRAGPRGGAGRHDSGHQPGDPHRHQRRHHQQPGEAEPAGPADSDPRAP